MKLYNILLEAAQVGRDWQHLEDNLIVKGSSGALEVLSDFKNIIENPSSTSHKWDGQAAIFWGHDNKGNFYLIPQAQWLKGLLLDKQGLSSEIQNTGRKKEKQTDSAFRAERLKLSQTYDRLWDVFEKASEGTQGFYKGDIMFASPVKPDKNGNYTFTPNKVTYTVDSKGLYGKMPTAQAFITIHGKPNKLGSNDLNSVSEREVQIMNRTPYLIAIGSQRPEGSLKMNVKNLDKIIKAVMNDSKDIDKIVNYVGPRFTTLKKVLYDYSIASGKNENLTFDVWLKTAKLSDPQKQQIEKLKLSPEWNKFWKTYDILKTLKKQIWQELTKLNNVEKKLGISSSIEGQPGGEGFMTPTGKIINPAFRSAPPNPRFQPL